MRGFSSYRRVTRFASLAAVLAALGTASADTIHYNLAINSSLEVKSPGQPKPQPLVATTGLRYQVDRQDSTDEVTLNNLEVKIATEGRSLMNSRMNREGATFQQGPKDETKISINDATPALKQLLEQFGKPLAKVTRDAEGAEVGRELLVEKDSSLIENGVIDNTQIFHVKFPANQNEWESNVKVSMGNGQFAQGTLRYKKNGTTPEGQVKVEVSGELKAEGKLGLGQINNGKYLVQGEQTYDPSRKAWTAGTLNIDLTLTIEANNQEAGNATGLLTIILSIPEAGAEQAAATPAATEAPTQEPVAK